MGRINYSKYLFPLFFVFSILSSIIPILLAIDLIRVESYFSFINLLDKWYITYSYFAKIIIANLDYTNFTFFHMLSTLYTSLSFINIVMILGVAYLVSSYDNATLLKYRKGWIGILLIYCFAYGCLSLLILFSFSLTTLNTIIILFKGVGVIMLITHILIILISGMCLYKLKRVYY